eukprot:TRINITY_DN8991_c0_g2_i1.p1 TRINITY_DN8991_c0_g2~~TRINITY_DN8991_c0_g2_i1.p1  ORF type:complete len:279 (+),score=31.97 TRINITY_DN8991_c0_g2_i1:82-918(+)
MTDHIYPSDDEFKQVFGTIEPAEHWAERAGEMDLIKLQKIRTKEQLAIALAHPEIAGRLASIPLPRSAFESAKEAFQTNAKIAFSEAVEGGQAKYRCLACFQSHGYPTAVQHCGATLRLPGKTVNNMVIPDWSKWTPCAWTALGMAFIEKHLRNTSKDAKPRRQSRKIKEEPDVAPVPKAAKLSGLEDAARVTDTVASLQATVEALTARLTTLEEEVLRLKQERSQQQISTLTSSSSHPSQPQPDMSWMMQAVTASSSESGEAGAFAGSHLAHSVTGL